jgi:hypothetical protein
VSTGAPEALPHLDAVEAALAASGLAVGVGSKPLAAAIPASGIYVVLHMGPGQAERESLADERTDYSAVFQVTCVAPDAARCLWAADRVREALHGPLTVAGRQAWRPEDLGGPPVDRDDSVSPPVYFVPIQYAIRSTA